MASTGVRTWSMTAGPITAAAMVTTAVGDDGFDECPSDSAQQLSACACDTVRWLSEPDDSDLCIGHSGSAQHAMRASGVGAQPAHRAALPTTSARLSASTDAHRLKVTTLVGCSTALSLSNARQQMDSFQIAIYIYGKQG